MRKARSLRHQLAFTYAGIALLTAALLGVILLAVLGGYYARAEERYLRAAAEQVVAIPPPADAAQLVRWAQLSALSTQTRVRVVDADGETIADSGSPRDLDPGALVPRDGEGGERGPRRERLPQPLGEGIFGGTPSDAPRSDRSVTLAVSTTGERIVISEAPASGREVLRAVAQGWTLAAALAVALAALGGYLLSSRLTAPIVALTEATDRMAAGDLAVRAPALGADETVRLAESFNEMAANTETTVTTLRRFVADAAHEIGTPLTALQADLELADAEATSQAEHRLVNRALGQARRLEELSANLLRLSRIEARAGQGETGRVELAALVRQAADAIASRAEAAGLSLEVAIEDEPLTVVAGAGAIQTVLESLLDNAVKFTPEGGELTVRLRRDGEDALVVVADTGIGIPQAERDAVFDRFHRARNVSSYPGSGLGLAIVRATVDQAGGSVTLASVPSGTAFEVRLPLA